MNYMRHNRYFFNAVKYIMLAYLTTLISLLITLVIYAISRDNSFRGGSQMTQLQRDIAVRYKKYKLSKKRIPFKEFCYPKEFKIQPQQAFLGEYMSPKGGIPKHGKTILVNHLIGAGKSIVMIEIAMAWAKRGKPLILMPASLIPGFLDEVAQRFPNFDASQLNVMSFNKFATSRKITAPILLIDEAQNITNQKGEYFNAISKFIEKRPELSVCLLTGTPIFDNHSELAAYARLMRLDLPGEFSPDDVRRVFAGKTSFFAGAPQYTFPEAYINIVKCKMSAYQSKWYLSEVEAERKGASLVLSEISNNFYIKSRQRANIVFPSGLTGADGLASLSKHIIEDKLATYSAKYAKLFKKIRKGNLAFIYADFTNEYGIASIVKCMKQFGYKNYLEDGPGKKRYAMFTGDQTMKEKADIRRVFNSAENDNAGQLQVIIGSPAIKSGVNLTRVREVHILNPYWNWSHLMQVMGRAIRFCSHKTLPRDMRFVDIYIYCAVSADYVDSDQPDVEKSVDLYMIDMADRKKEKSEPYLKALTDTALDRGLFQ